MELPRFDLVDWLVANAGAPHDLATSAIAPVDIADLGIKIERLSMMYAEVGGSKALRKLLSDVYGVKDESITVSCGCQEANYLAAAAFLKPGDKVAAETPCYLPVLRMPALLGCKIIPLRRRPSASFDVEMHILEDVLGKGAKAVFLTNLHNPSGRMAREPQLQEICDAVERHRALLVMDEVYREFNPRPPPMAFHLSENAVSTNSLSKAYGMGGARVGWAFAHGPLPMKMQRVKDYTTVICAGMSELVAVAALEKRDGILARARKIVSENLSALDDWMARQRTFRWTRPDEANISFPKLPPGTKSVDFCRKALKRGVLLAPGKYLGLEGYVRFTCGTLPEKFRASLRALEPMVEGA
ncbi:MAG: pyridoxal phosphate-dependent aminotransferase [Euryarchaeota archaeon]|nr:pyridoxal phosphate-dependent aminotransferase [Euryarchaeota archaeon]